MYFYSACAHHASPPQPYSPLLQPRFLRHVTRYSCLAQEELASIQKAHITYGFRGRTFVMGSTDDGTNQGSARTNILVDQVFRESVCVLCVSAYIQRVYFYVFQKDVPVFDCDVFVESILIMCKVCARSHSTKERKRVIERRFWLVRIECRLYILKKKIDMVIGDAV